MQQFSFGSDPEFMVFDREGRMRSAIGIVRGTKEKKLNLGRGNFAFYDNVNLEVNTRPAYTAEEVVENLLDCFLRVVQAIAPYAFGPIASHLFHESELTHKDAKVFGCDPEFCAYTLGIVTPPTSTDGFRSAGGHIHLGAADGVPPLMCPCTDEDKSDREWSRVRVIRMMDLFIGVPSVLLDTDPSSAARRRLYGKAGSHRPKDYGIEYRSMGNFWLASPALVHLIFDLSMWVLKFVQNGGYGDLWKDDEVCVGYNVADVRAAIDTTNRALASEIMNGVVKEYLPDGLFRQIFAQSDGQRLPFYREWKL